MLVKAVGQSYLLLRSLSKSYKKMIQDGSTVWIKGQVIHVINSDKCVYSSCSECRSGTDTPIGEKFSCSQTKTPHIGTSMYRYKLHVRFEDESPAIKLTLFHELAEKVLGRTATEISCLSQEERLSLVSDFVFAIDSLP